MVLEIQRVPNFLLGIAVRHIAIYSPREVATKWYGENPQKSADLTRLINERQFNRLKGMLDRTPKEKIVFGGDTDAEDKYIGESSRLCTCLF